PSVPWEFRFLLPLHPSMVAIECLCRIQNMAQGCNLIFSKEDADNFPIPDKVHVSSNASEESRIASLIGSDKAPPTASIISVTGTGELAINHVNAAICGVPLTTL